MNFSDELCRLVIRHMNVVEESPKVIEEIEHSLFEAIHERFELLAKNSWGEEIHFWPGERERGDVKNKKWGLHALWFLPHEWYKYNEEEGVGMHGEYSLDFTRNDKNIHKLSAAVGVRGSQLRLGFKVVDSTGTKSWRDHVERTRQFYMERFSEESSGLQFFSDEGVIGLCFALDSEKVAEEYPNFDEALTPVDKALEALLKNHEVFDGFIKTLFELQKRASTDA